MTNLRRSTRKRGNDDVTNETTTNEKNKNDNDKAINGSKASIKTEDDTPPPPPPKRVKTEDNDAKVEPPPTDTKEASSEDTKVKSNTIQQKQTQDVSPPPIISAGAASAAMVASKKKPDAAAATKTVLSPSVSSSSDASSKSTQPQPTQTVIKTEETNVKTESTNGKTIPTTTTTANTTAAASSNTSKAILQPTAKPPPQNTKQIPKTAPIQQQPQKEVKTYDQLQNKYSSELHYMLVEFRKLERQLLGAPGNGTATTSTTAAGQVKTEAAGSKERREKLHGFILHLEDTIRQITEGCNLEKECNAKGEGGEVKKVSDNTLDGDQKKDGAAASTPNQEEGESATTTPITTAKEREELVHKLEEHILANLLPVKARLTRQLAAQKGAKLNPATAPVQPGKATEGAGAAPVSTSLSGGTFTATVEAKRKAQEKALLLAQEKARQAELLKHKKPVGSAVPSQYGKVIGGARSSLTSRLHGRILGPPGSNTASGGSATTTSSSVPDPTNSASTTANTTSKTSPSKRPILYAGIAPGSTQVPSSINAVSGVHPGLIDESAVRGVANAEEERIRLAQLEASAARVAGLATTTVGGVTTKAGVGPATLAARAHAAAVKPSSITAPRPSSIPPKQQQPIAKKPKKKHVSLDYNNTSLSNDESFDMRLKEARWRQCKRRRVRKRNQISGSGSSSSGGTTTVGGSTQANRAVIQQPVATTTVPAAATHTIQQQPQQQIAQPPPPPPKPSPPQQPKKPPNQRTVEYICAMCNESYPSNSNMNPWWALSSEECPKCGKTQVSFFLYEK